MLNTALQVIYENKNIPECFFRRGKQPNSVCRVQEPPSLGSSFVELNWAQDLEQVVIIVGPESQL